jgi:hypothetical protein
MNTSIFLIIILLLFGFASSITATSLISVTVVSGTDSNNNPLFTFGAIYLTTPQKTVTMTLGSNNGNACSNSSTAGTVIASYTDTQLINTCKYSVTGNGNSRTISGFIYGYQLTSNHNALLYQGVLYITQVLSSSGTFQTITSTISNSNINVTSTISGKLVLCGDNTTSLTTTVGSSICLTHIIYGYNISSMTLGSITANLTGSPPQQTPVNVAMTPYTITNALPSYQNVSYWVVLSQPCTDSSCQIVSTIQLSSFASQSVAFHTQSLSQGKLVSQNKNVDSKSSPTFKVLQQASKPGTAVSDVITAYVQQGPVSSVSSGSTSQSSSSSSSSSSSILFPVVITMAGLIFALFVGICIWHFGGCRKGQKTEQYSHVDQNASSLSISPMQIPVPIAAWSAT